MSAAAPPVLRCPLCAGDRVAPRFPHGRFTIFACRDCGGGFAWPRPRPDELAGVYDEAYADDYSSGTMADPAVARRRFVRLEASLERRSPGLLDGAGRRVLDVGCASGVFAGEFLRRGWRAEGVELSPRLAAAARSIGVAVHEGEFLRLALPGGAFDLITMFHLIEHLDVPAAALEKCRELLRPGGTLVVETPNWRGIGALLRGSRWSRIKPPEHLNYFGPGALRELLLGAGFAVARTVTVTPEVIEVASRAPRPVRRLVRGGFGVARLLGVGTTLQAFARKAGGPAAPPGEASA